MEQSNRIQRSEVWEQIYKVVKTIPRADCNEMDTPDAPSVATELEELFLKLLPIQRDSSSLSTDDLHFKLRTIFFDKMEEHWVEDDMIHMDYVSDAFEETIHLFLEDYN